MTVELVFIIEIKQTWCFHAFVTPHCAYQSIENKHMCDNKSEPRLTGERDRERKTTASDKR